MKGEIDQTDCRIIELLQKDGRMPNTMKYFINNQFIASKTDKYIECFDPSTGKVTHFARAYYFEELAKLGVTVDETVLDTSTANESK